MKLKMRHRRHLVAAMGISAVIAAIEAHQVTMRMLAVLKVALTAVQEAVEVVAVVVAVAVMDPGGGVNANEVGKGSVSVVA
jgi:hypothetical protein